jgi:hypothetical protein
MFELPLAHFDTNPIIIGRVSTATSKGSKFHATSV